MQLYGGQRIFRSTMTQNRKLCAALYLEAEYDALTLEAYWQARVTTERLKNGRYPFSCIFCKEIHKDKNTTSYHRMFNLCTVYKEAVSLKMYPTWKKSDQTELTRIAQKYGKVFQHNMVGRPPSNLKRKAEDDLQLPPLKYHNLAKMDAHKLQASRSEKKLRPKVKDVLQRVKFEDELNEHSEEHSETPYEKVVIEKHTPLVALPSFTNVHCTYLDIASDENAFHLIEQHRSVRTFTREDIEERAWKETKEKFPDGNPADVLPPPMPVDISRLFILITEVDVDWMPKDLINDPLVAFNFFKR